MATSLKLKLAQAPRLLFKTLPRIPSNILGGDGITVVKANGVFTVSANAGSGIFQISDADLTALAALTGTNTIYYRSAAATWSPVTVNSPLSFSGGVLSTANMAAATINGNPTGATAAPTNFTIQGLTDIATPDPLLDFISIYNHTTGTIQRTTAAQVLAQSAKQFRPEDYASLNVCITAASLVNGTVVLARGTSYALNSAVSVTGPFNIIGEGAGIGPGAVSNTLCSQIMVTFADGDAITVTTPYSCIFDNFQGSYNGGRRTSGAFIKVTDASNTNNGSVVNKIAFNGQFDCIHWHRCTSQSTTNCYAQAFQNTWFKATTDTGVEANTGFVSHNHIFGDTNNDTTADAAIETHCGYGLIHDNLLGGTQKGIHVNVDTTSIAELVIHDNAVENNIVNSLLIENASTHTCHGLTVDNFWCCNIDDSTLMTNHILVKAGSSDWIDGLTIRNVKMRSNFTTIGSGCTLISVLRGTGAKIENVWADILGGAAKGIQVGSSVDDAVIEKFHWNGAGTKYDIDGDTQAFDNQGVTVVNLPGAAKDGSRFWVTDANPVLPTPTSTATNPGAWVERRNGAWVTIIGGTAAVTQGGTGGTSWAINGIMLGQASSPLGVTAALTDGQIPVGQTGAALLPKTITGDWTLSAAGTATLATVNSNVGTFGSATQVAQVTVNAKGQATAAANVTITPAVGSITGLGTGIATALGVNVGSAGAPVVNGGALGTPSSGVATNLTGTASSLTSGNVTTNANLTGEVTSVGNTATVAAAGRLKTKTVSFTRDLTAASGAVAYTGVGFVPTSIQIWAAQSGVSGASFGVSDSALSTVNMNHTTDATALWTSSNVRIVNYTNAAGTTAQDAALTSYDADGFTLTWTKTGSPTGTLSLRVVCSR